MQITHFIYIYDTEEFQNKGHYSSWQWKYKNLYNKITIIIMALCSLKKNILIFNHTILILDIIYRKLRFYVTDIYIYIYVCVCV